MSLRIVFMGTPEFAVPSLRILHETGYEIRAVVTATDKYGGRGGRQLLESPVKKYAVAAELPVLQPANLKDPGFVSSLKALGADLQVVVAFRMLPEVVWNMPPMGTVNLHASLLPAYRGAAPINWAIINGETVTGLTTFKLKHEIDTGNILLQREIQIGPDDTAGDLHDRMMHLGATLVLETVQGLERGTLVEKPQAPGAASHAPKLHHDTCQIDFRKPAAVVHNFIRGLSPHPGAWTLLDGKLLKIYRSVIRSHEPVNEPPGTVTSIHEKVFVVACNPGSLQILELQLEGKKRMSIEAFLRGYPVVQSTVLGSLA